MARISELKLRGSELKKFMLHNQIDDNGKKISIRQFINTSWKDIGGAYKTTGTYTRWCRSDEIINSEPYRGEHINIELVYKYGKDNGLIKIPFTKFANKKQINKTVKMSPNVKQTKVEQIIFGEKIIGDSTLKERRDACVLLVGEDRYEELWNEVTRD